MRRKGFSLIECLVYLSLIGFIASSSVLLIARLWSQGSLRTQRQQIRMELHSAFDLMNKDLMPLLTVSWKKKGNQAVIWSGQNGVDIGYLFQDGKLYRAAGLYNRKRESWQKKRSQLVAIVENATFEIGDAYVKITLQRKNIAVSGMVSIGKPI